MSENRSISPLDKTGSHADEQTKQSVEDQLLGKTRPLSSRASETNDYNNNETRNIPSDKPYSQNSKAEISGNSEIGERNSRRGSLRDDTIEDKHGNYILSFGRPYSGKTTFQSFLLYYLTHATGFKSNLLISPEDTATGWDAQRIYNAWMDNWQRGEFPMRTDAREESIRELTLSVTPKTGNQTNLTFSFLEVSGELMEKILPTDEDDPVLPKTLVRYLENSKIKFAILLFINPETAQKDDQLFDNLFTYLDINFPELRNQMSLGIVISKPEKSLEIFKKNWPGFSHHASLKGDVCEDYLERMTPRLFQTLNSWDRQENTQIMSMSLGDVEFNHTDGSTLLVRKDFNDIQKTFAWLYKQFSGEALGLRWWEKLVKWLRE